MEGAPDSSRETLPDHREVFDVAELMEEEELGGCEGVAEFLAQVTVYLQAFNKNIWRNQVRTLQGQAAADLITRVESKVKDALDAGITPEEIMIEAATKWADLEDWMEHHRES